MARNWHLFFFSPVSKAVSSLSSLLLSLFSGWSLWQMTFYDASKFHVITVGIVSGVWLSRPGESCAYVVFKFLHLLSLSQYGGQMPQGPMPGMPPQGMQSQGMPGGPMGGPMPGPMGGPMGGAPPAGGYGSYGGYPGAYGAAAPAANDPMWGYFTAIAGQVSLTKEKLKWRSCCWILDTWSLRRRASSSILLLLQKKRCIDLFLMYWLR